jgi:PAS domain S-box-containing protein
MFVPLPVKASRFAILIDDITERKRAETELGKSSQENQRLLDETEKDLSSTQLLRDLAQHLPGEGDIQPVYEQILNAAITIAKADAGTVQILDEETEELVVLATRGFSPAVVEHFRRVSARSNTSCGVALATNQRCFIDFDTSPEQDPDGSLRMHVQDGYYSAQSTPLVSRNGKAIGMVSTHWRQQHRPTERQLYHIDLLARQAADVIVQWRAKAEREKVEGALRTSEERVRAIISQSTAGIAEAATDGTFSAVNAQFCKILGYTEQELLGGMRIVDVTHLDDLDLTRGMFSALLATGHGFVMEKRYVRKDRSVVWVNKSASAILDADGHVRGIAVVVADISERKQAEEALRESTGGRTSSSRSSRTSCATRWPRSAARCRW